MIANEPATEPRRQRTKPGLGRLLAFFAVVALLVGAGIIGGLMPRLARQKTLLAASQEVAQAVPVAHVAVVRTAAPSSSIELPADLQSVAESPIFARVDGYLGKRLVDIGDRVKAGQVLGEIETPDLDRQIDQARATLAQVRSSLKELQANVELAKANLELAGVTYERWRNLTAKGVVSRQEGDERRAAFNVRQAESEKAQATLSTAQDSVRASEANLQRLEEVKSFARVTAPFDGIVTTRNVEIGTLINAGNGGAAREMFRVAQIQVLRAFVNVPQTYVGSIKAGQHAELRVQELPGQIFPAIVTRAANALDSANRSMLAIAEAQNPRGLLMPGMYAQVRFTLARPAAALVIPGDSLLTGRTGPRVAVVGPDKVVHFRNIAISQDLGSEIEISSGLTAGQQVVLNPTDAIREGVTVDVRVTR